MNTLLQKVTPPEKTVATVKRYWLSLAFVTGFIVDNLTLNNVEQVFDNVILATQVVLAMSSMLLLYAAMAQKLPERYNAKVRTIAPLVMQYSFGGLLSGMLIFYGRAGALANSWPYLLLIVLAIYGNETIKNRGTRLLYNLAILFLGLFSYVVLIVPVLTGYMGALTFVFSGLLALMIMYTFIQILYRIIPRFMEYQMKGIIFTIGSIFVSLNFLYFTNIIPPIPLSLKDVGIYHSVVRFDNGDYQVKYEAGEWWQPFKDSDYVYHPTPGGNVYCFAEVFAPTRVETKIVHYWEKKHPTTGKWEQQFTLSYPIAGGRDAGYRGYTQKGTISDGEWRCRIATERGQILGQEKFIIDSTESAKDLVTEMR